MKNLTYKTWCPEGSAFADVTEKTATERLEEDLSTSTDSDATSSSSETDLVDVEMQLDRSEASSREDNRSQQKDGCSCVICSKEYALGDQIYESNNSQCKHEFHKECIDKWLNFQNSCPICTQPFVIHTV